MNDQIMQNPLDAMLAQASIKNTLFPANSRYYRIDTKTIVLVSGKPVVYLQRRFVPGPDQFQLLQEHVVSQGDRLDNIAASYMGDPLLFWRLCDANNAMLPESLTETIGRQLRVTLPQDISGTLI